MRKLFIGSQLLLSILVAIPVFSRAATWPDDIDWIPLEGVKSNPVVDPTGDVPGGLMIFDIVGAGGDAAGYVYVDPSTVYFRVRLADSPQYDPTKWDSFSFFVLMETDDDYSDNSYDHAVHFDGLNETVEVGENAIPIMDWCSDTIDGASFTYPAPPDFTGNARVVPAGTTLGGGSDSFLDIQIPLADWASLTGVPDLMMVQIVLGTSSTGSSINKDTADLECGESWGSIPVSVESATWGHLKATYRD